MITDRSITKTKELITDTKTYIERKLWWGMFVFNPTVKYHERIFRKKMAKTMEKNDKSTRK